MNFTWEAIGHAGSSLERLKRLVIALKNKAQPGANIDSPYKQEFIAAIAEDLNMPKALSVFWKVAQDNTLSESDRLAILYAFDQVTGFGIKDWQETQKTLTDEVNKLVADRDAARRAKNWAESDRLRTTLQEMGYSVEDTPQGTKVS